MADAPPLTQHLGQAETALRAVLDRLLGEAGATFYQWVTLSMVARAGSPVPQNQLVRRVSDAIKVSEPVVETSLRELTTAGLVGSVGTPASVALTPAGDARFQQLRRRIDTVTARLYGDLPPNDMELARRVLTIVTQRANAELER